MTSSILFLIFLLAIPLQMTLNQSTDSCFNQNTCHECIQSKGCAWCSKPSLDQSSNHGPSCFPSSFISNGRYECEQKYLFDPVNEDVILLNKNLTKIMEPKLRTGGLLGQDIVQISPQKIGLKLRLNEPHRISFKYSRAEDYPVDLYYLMDLSRSMKDDKDKLSNLGDLLAETMRNITKDFRLGFGSFVDKALMPYASTIPEKLEKPCDDCAAPYGFKNHMKLDTNTNLFSQEVNRAQISGNIDSPEGGFDALMQVIVCEEEIGWRSQARRLVIFSTDAGFHYAGDGKLAGVISPNDARCHMVDHTYTHSKLQDYPSVAQINKVAKEHAVNLIFAVTKDQVDVYEKLAKKIEGSSFSQLENDSSNIVDLIKEGYNKLSSSVEIKDDSNNFVTLKYFSKCLKGQKLLETNKCDDLKVGEPVEFEVDITAVTCPEYPVDKKTSIKIYPVGIDEALELDIELICSCDCAKSSDPNYEEHSPKCNSHGTHKCGICECDEGFYGRKCECSNRDSFEGSNSDSVCRPDNMTLVDCNGRGSCICGVCECHTRPNPVEKISGKFCECDNFSCDRHNGLICSGSDHGTCQCGECRCLEGWKGPACACSSKTETCRASRDTDLCSGHGECVCGECTCETTQEGRYSGRYCEKCPTCPGRCQEFKDCVQCKLYKTGLYSKDADICDKNCTHIFAEVTEKVEVSEDIYDHLCNVYDENNCRFQFVYNDRDEHQIIIRAQEQPECPPKIFTLGVILGIIASILLIGLATLLLWKLFTTIHDRKEYARFLEESKNAKFNAGVNPLYKQATTTINNPMYTDG